MGWGAGRPKSKIVLAAFSALSGFRGATSGGALPSAVLRSGAFMFDVPFKAIVSKMLLGATRVYRIFSASRVALQITLCCPFRVMSFRGDVRLETMATLATLVDP